jgi:hypothetical protein
MIWKRYRNEMIVLASFLLMLAALIYKNSTVNRLDSVNAEVKASLSQIGEIIALKKQWGDTGLSKKIEQIKKKLPANKIKQWSIKGKKLFASFRGLSDNEVNSVILKLENTAVQILKLSVKREGETYSMEIKCKW